MATLPKPWPVAADSIARERAGDATTGLLARCLVGEEWALGALYNQFAPMLYRLAYSLLQNREDAEEVLQDSFEYAFRRLNYFDPARASLKTWLYQITISRCRNKRRRKWLPTFSLGAMTEADVADQESPRPDELADLSDRQRVVWQALAELSAKLRETAVLRYYEALSYSEIGAILGIPAKTVESRMRLAHAALRHRLAELNDESK
jgi:RNA polymerase sigma-70 factor (ECF subfamily)